MEALMLNGMIAAKNNESIDSVIKAAFIGGMIGSGKYAKLERTKNPISDLTMRDKIVRSKDYPITTEVEDTTYEEVKPNLLSDGSDKNN